MPPLHIRTHLPCVRHRLSPQPLVLHLTHFYFTHQCRTLAPRLQYRAELILWLHRAGVDPLA